MKRSIFILIILILVYIPIIIIADDKPIEPNSISIKDQQSKQELQNAYNAIVSANKDFQIAILRAKVKYKVPEDWEINLNTLSFEPPKKEEKKP